MRRSVVTLVMSLGVAGCVFAVDIYIAPINYQLDESVTAEHVKLFVERDWISDLDDVLYGSDVSFKLASNAEGCPSSFLEAKHLCESEGYSYLIYGFLKRDFYSYRLELKLVSRERSEVVRIFIASDDTEHYQRLLRDASNKVIEYLNAEVGLKVTADGYARIRRNVIRVPVSAGYWVPLTSEWYSRMIGMVSASTGLEFVPTYSLFKVRNRPCFLMYGARANYYLGMNQSDDESFYYHFIQVGIGASVFMNIGNKQLVGVGVEPYFQFDVARYTPEYGASQVLSGYTSGVALNLSYEYTFSNRYALGIESSTSVSFYDSPLVRWSPQVYVRFSFDGKDSR
jgi:hypothetical protein